MRLCEAVNNLTNIVTTLAGICQDVDKDEIHMLEVCMETEMLKVRLIDPTYLG